MAFNDTLFQLGMDLTRSSTAQKEDRSFVASGAVRRKTGSETAGHGGSQTGTSIIIDLHGVAGLDVKRAERALRLAFTGLSGFRLVPAANGLLDGSARVGSDTRLAVRAMPGAGRVSIDIQCRAGLDANGMLFALADAFGAREAVIQKSRGSDVVFLPAAKAGAVGKDSAKPARAKQARAA